MGLNFVFLTFIRILQIKQMSDEKEENEEKKLKVFLTHNLNVFIRKLNNS